MNAAEVLASAIELLENPREGLEGVWPRAVAVLGRQALEMRMGELLSEEIGESEGVSARAKLLCLRALGDESEAEEVGHAWWALSRACHHHTYELAPTASELRRWLGAVERIVGG